LAYDFDLAVIGCGPAGEKGAVQAAYFGKTVAVIEKEQHPGGAAVNTGTLPSKTLRETALYLSGLRQRELHGVTLKLDGAATPNDLLRHSEKVIDDERSHIEHNLFRHKVTRIPGEGSFVDPHTLVVHHPGAPERKLTAQHILIATGSSPVRPPLWPFDERRVYDSDEITKVDEIPNRMAVMGGGVIGCEYACLFAALGVKVTLVEPKNTILGFLDGEMRELLARRMEAIGITFRLNDNVKEVACDWRSVRMVMQNGDALETDAVLVAAGRQAATARLNLEAAGLTAGKRGQLEVDGAYRTKVPHIYAVGDVIGFPALASTAMEQARLAVVDAFQLNYKTRLAGVLPYGIFTIPEVSMAGETEESLREKGMDYVVGRAHFRDNARGRIIGEEHGMVKLLFAREDMMLLGVHVLGETATELVHQGLLALLAGAKADLFINACFNYPTLSEAYKYATYDALGARNRREPAQ
jgi:NAD(P) transhydrogenase